MRFKFTNRSEKRSHRLPPILGVALMAIVPAVGLASSLPPSGVGETIDDLNGNLLAGSASPGCAQTNVATACAGLGFDPSVSAFDVSSKQIVIAAVAFNFELIGAPEVAVPLIIGGTALASGANYGGGISLGLFDFPLSFFTLFEFSSPHSPPHGSFTIHTLGNSDAVSQMIVEVDCLSITNGATCESSIDPTIEIDPSFADASQFKLIESTGSTGTVPEPSAMILLGTGMLVLVRKLSARGLSGGGCEEGRLQARGLWR